MDASTNAAPSVGWPANGSSAPGVKIRSFRVLAGLSAGNTNTVSERLSSRAIACINLASSPMAEGKTASWFPPNISVVNTSAVKKRRLELIGISSS